MRQKFLPALLVALALGSLQALAEDKKIERKEIKPTAVGSGAEMYTNYCAVCHGLNGKGAGPAAAALKAALPDLSLMAQKNGGKFPADHVASSLKFGTDISAHGSAAMPIWGPLFKSLNKTSEAEVQLRIANLTKYLESLQVK